MRRAWLELKYQGTNISADIAPDLLSFSFHEKADKEADKISLSLADPSGKWQNEWAVSHGDVLHPVIHYENWYREGDLYRLDCGTFELDEDELSSSHSGDVVTISALPSAVQRSLFNQKKSKTWENATLERVARDIAEAAEHSLVYQAEEIQLKRADQRQESDLSYLQKLCTAHGCRLRLTEGNLVVTSAAQADAATAIILTRQEGDSLNSRRSKHDVYSRAVVTYTDPQTGRTTRHIYPGKSEQAAQTGKELTLNQRVANYSEAVQVAKAALRDKNAKQQSATFSGQDRPEARAGATVDLQGWGVYGGRMHLAQVEHNLSGNGAARCRLTLEKTLEY